MYNFTVIIPHYNIPALLERCVKSIPERDDIQVIVVDDCSDGSVELDSVFRKLRTRQNLEIYKTPIGGSAGRARNIGIEQAKGKWLLFADADDFFDESIETILDENIDAEEEVIFFNYRSVLSNNTAISSFRKDKEYDQFQNHIDCRDDLWFRYEFHVPWSKMIKHNLVEKYKIRYDETRYANDAMFAVMVGCKAKSVKIVDKVLYVLTEREGSLCSNFCSKPGEAAIRAKVSLRLEKVMREHLVASRQNYTTFLRTILWNREYTDYFTIYHESDSLGISKCELRKIVYGTGKRYYPLVVWLVWKELWSVIKRT